MKLLKNSKLFYLITMSAIVALLSISTFAAGVVYVKDGGSGNGSSASAPVGTLTDAFNALGDEGGTIVVCGVCTISEQFIEPAHTGKVTVTSKYNSVNYATKSSAAVEFYNNYYISGPTVFNYITLRACTDGTKTHPYNGIFGRANNFTLGTSVTTELGEGCSTYLSIIGGSYATYKNKAPTITIKSGTWQRVRGGASKSGGTNYDINMVINGGTFIERIVLSSAAASIPSSYTSGALCSHNGDIKLTVTDGTFVGGIFATAHLVDDDIFSGDVAITLNGGTFYETIGVAAEPIGTHNGSFTLNINGGEYQHLLGIVGTTALTGAMTSTVTYGEDIDLEKAESGNISFTNYLRKNNADPFMFYHDGYYYYTATGATSVSLIKVANIVDIKTVAGHTILSPDSYTDLWSPEIHYFSADEIGEEYAGWYMFVGAKEKDASGTIAENQRQYVAKCLDGDNFLGRWGDPVTGEVNVLRKMTFANGGYNDNALCGGSSPIRINGKVYLTFVSEKGRGTSEFHQTINITTFETPWNITGTPVEICRPDYDWEKNGYWYGENANGEMTWWPQVVEGASAVYSNSGDVYLMYTGSGYWTTWYALGYLKFTGTNPLSKSSWTKNKNPVLQRVETLTEESVNGCGHGSYFTDHAGQMWVAYHGYIGVDTSSKRFSFVEPIYVTSSGVSIGNKTGHPAAVDKVYKVTANPMSLSEKISGFDTLSVNTITDMDEGVTLRYNPVEGTLIYMVRRDGKLLYQGTELSVLDTEATPGEHTYTVQAIKSGSILSKETAVEIARNNLNFKDVNSDGKFSVLDVLTVLKDFLNANELKATLVDIVQMLKCV